MSLSDYRISKRIADDGYDYEEIIAAAGAAAPDAASGAAIERAFRHRVSDYAMARSAALRSPDYTFASLIMGALRRADTSNTLALKNAFPKIYDEFYARYWAPGGVIDESERE